MSEVRQVACPYCAKDATPIFSRYGKRFLKCQECALIFLHPDDRQREDYTHRYAEDWEREWRGEGRKAIFLEALSHCPRPRGGNLLDLGCGGGTLLSLAAQQGWNVWGVDPALNKESWACEMIRERIVPSLKSLPKNVHFQAVCCINVIDHVKRPWDVLEQISNRMTQDSILVMRIPNCRLHRAVHQVAYYMPAFIRNRLLSLSIMHEYCLEPRFICRLLKDKGFDHVRIIPSVASQGDVYGQGKAFMFSKTLLNRILYSMSRLTKRLTPLSTSVLVIAEK